MGIHIHAIPTIFLHGGSDRSDGNYRNMVVVPINIFLGFPSVFTYSLLRFCVCICGCFPGIVSQMVICPYGSPIAIYCGRGGGDNNWPGLKTCIVITAHAYPSLPPSACPSPWQSFLSNINSPWVNEITFIFIFIHDIIRSVIERILSNMDAPWVNVITFIFYFYLWYYPWRGVIELYWLLMPESLSRWFPSTVWDVIFCAGCSASPLWYKWVLLLSL